MKLRVFALAALFAVSPLFAFLAGAAYFGIVKSVFTHKCKEYEIESLCLPGHVLTLGGFMPAVMIFTVPVAVVFVVVYVVRALSKGRGAPDIGRGGG
jgi:large-conductance mechanosensitive channel